MVGEDYRSRAAHNNEIVSEQKVRIKAMKKQIKTLEADNLKKEGKIERNAQKLEGYIMEKEDVCAYYTNLQDRTKSIDVYLKEVLNDKEDLKTRIETVEKEYADLKAKIESGGIDV
jgi:chromosome segregation ATPase